MTKKPKLAVPAALDAPSSKEAAVLDPLKAKARARAHTLLRPAVRAGISISAFTPPGLGAGLMDLIGELAKQEAALLAGSLARPEAMLLAQALTLDTIFNDLTLKAVRSLPDSLGNFEILFRLAFKAQAQSRATLETLAAVKNPSTVFARQANFATGPQQVNNYGSGKEPNLVKEPRRKKTNARVEILEYLPNELMEPHYAERLVAGAAQTSSPGDRSLAALGAVHGPANRSGQGKIIEERS